MAEILTSYAQNLEDVILWRALKHVRQGYYVDVGAGDPVTDSVSLAFYERGWRGLNVEPEPQAAARLREARPGDEVLQAAVAATSGSIGFYAIKDTGLSTCDAVMAQRHADNGYPVTETTVPCLPLSQVLDQAQGREVHWLKIDVEGMESAVIEGWAPSPVRPWIVVVEVVGPYGLGASTLDWEPTLLGLDYKLVYFDGLNRFYLSGAHRELLRHFGPGPNIFDGFALSGRATSTFSSALLAENRAAQLHAAEVARRTEAKAADLVRAAEERAADHVRAAEEKAAHLVRVTEESAAARCEDLRSAMTALETSNATTAKALGLCRRELRAQRRKLWREQVHRREVEANHAEVARRLDAVHAAAAAFEARLHEVWRAADITRRELVALHASWSWRLTALLRWTTQSLRAGAAWVARGARALGGLGQRLGGLTIEAGLGLVRDRPRLKRGLLLAIGLVPGLSQRVACLVLARSGTAQAARASGAPVRAHGPATSFDLHTLPPSARRAYSQLAAARAAQAAS